MALAEIGDDLAAFLLRGDIADDMAFLLRAVEAIRLGGRGVDLENSVAIEVAELDFVNKGVLFVVELFDGVAAVLRPYDGDDALIVGRGYFLPLTTGASTSPTKSRTPLSRTSTG